MNIKKFPDRFVLSKDEMRLPGILEFGRLSYSKAHRPLIDHSHGKAMEICVLAKGRQTYIVKNEHFHLVPGDVFIAFPGEVHGSGIYSEEKSILFWLIIDSSGLKTSFLSLPKTDSLKLLRALKSIRSRMFFGGQEIVDAVLELMIAARERDRLSHARLEALSILFIDRLVRVSQKQCARVVSEGVGKAISHIAAHIDGQLRIGEMARVAGLSTSRFKQVFRKTTGVGPAEYVLRMKVERAVNELCEGKRNVTDIAYDLGFSSSQYFSVVFRRIMGIRPTDVRGKN